MLDNDLMILLATVVYALVAIGMFVLSFNDRHIAWRNRRFAKSVGLELSEELKAPVGRRMARRQRGASVGILVATAILYPLAAVEHHAQSGSTGWALLYVGGLFTGLALGVAIASATRPQEEHAAVRYARPRAVGLADYIAPIERNGARIVAVVATLLLPCSLLLTSLDAAPATVLPPSTLSGICVLLAILTLSLFEVFGRRIVARPQAAGSPAELAWDDALRAWTVRDLVTAPLTLGLYTTLLSITDLMTFFGSRLSPGPAPLLINIGALLLGIAVLLIAIIATASSPQQHFLRRLWPELVPPAMPALVTAPRIKE